MHYGWVICITCTLLLFVTMGTVSNGFSVYLPYIMEEKGLTNAQTSSLVTLRCAVSFLSMLVIGFYYQKVSIRVGTTIAAAAAGVSFLLYSAAEAYPCSASGAAISGVSYGLGSMIPVSILINRWFYQHRAPGLSICASGSIATIVLPPCDHRPGGKPVHGHYLPDRGRGHLSPGGSDLPGPAEPAGGQRPAPLRPDPGPGGRGPGLCQPGPPAGDDPPDVEFLSGCASLFYGGLGQPRLLPPVGAVYLRGFSSATVALIISGTGVMITLGKLVFGEATDHIGGGRSTLLFGGILVVGHVLCCLAFTQSLVLAVLTVLFLGLGYPIATMGPSVWSNDLAAPEQYPTVVRRLQVIYMPAAPWPSPACRGSWPTIWGAIC